MEVAINGMGAVGHGTAEDLAGMIDSTRVADGLATVLLPLNSRQAILLARKI